MMVLYDEVLTCAERIVKSASFSVVLQQTLTDLLPISWHSLSSPQYSVVKPRTRPPSAALPR